MQKFEGYADNIENNLNKVTSIDENSTDEQYPSAKAVYEAIPDTSQFLSKSNDTKYHAYTDLIFDENCGIVADYVYINGEVEDNDQAIYKGYADERYLQISSKVTNISSSSTNNQISSAKAVYDLVQEALYVDTEDVIIPAEV